MFNRLTLAPHNNKKTYRQHELTVGVLANHNITIPTTFWCEHLLHTSPAPRHPVGDKTDDAKWDTLLDNDAKLHRMLRVCYNPEPNPH